MRVLIIANHFAVCSGRYIADAFTRLGHDVKHIGAPQGRAIWGLTLPPGCEWTPDAVDSEWTPELIVVADSDPSLNPLLHQWRGASEPSRGGVPTIVWGVDNHVRSTYQHFWADHYFLAHRKVSQMIWEQPKIQFEFGPIGKNQIFHMTYLPCAYDPTVHTPSPIPYTERDYDVALLGMITGYPHRMQAVRELQAAGLRVLWGCGFVGEDYASAHHNARIALNLSFNGDVGQRLFETAALGNLVMSDYCADFDLLKPEGVWIIEQGKPLAAQVQAILEQPTLAEISIAKSLAWARPHTWDNRAQAVIAHMSNRMEVVAI